jgi:hypothetical protein
MVLILCAHTGGFLPSPLLPSAMVFDLGWAQKWAHFSLLKVPTSESKSGYWRVSFMRINPIVWLAQTGQLGTGTHMSDLRVNQDLAASPTQGVMFQRSGTPRTRIARGLNSARRERAFS